MASACPKPLQSTLWHFKCGGLSSLINNAALSQNSKKRTINSKAILRSGCRRDHASSALIMRLFLITKWDLLEETTSVQI